MKKFITTLATLAVAFSTMAATAQAEVKVASVDMSELHIMFYKRVEVETSLRKQEAAIQEEINVRQEKLRKLSEDAQQLQKQYDPTLSEAATKSLREKAAAIKNEFDAAQEELKTFVQRRQLSFNEIVRRELALLSKELHDAVAKVAAEGGYDIVVDSSAVSQTPGGRVFPFVTPTMDISPAVLKILNADAPADFDPQAELQRVRGAAAAPAAPAAE